ncbi:MAG: hypothetical protein WCT07_04020 [Candidatus Paceibacterota bacterium]|jgi:hypothetical protein
MATYQDDTECISASIIIRMNDADYQLAFNAKKNITTLRKLDYFVEPQIEYVATEICTINYVIEWNDMLSAYQVISRLLKIKAFS